LLFLPPPGDIAIRRVCWLDGLFVGVRSLVRIKPPTAMAGGRQARVRHAGCIADGRLRVRLAKMAPGA